MKKTTFFPFLLSTVYFALFALTTVSPAFAHDWGPALPSECGPDHTYNGSGMCIHVTSLGKITPPAGIPTTGSDPSSFVASLIRNGILLMIIVAFVAALIWTILAGFKFIMAQGEPKEISAAQSQITWGIIGLVVVLTAYAIVRIVETFFGITIISGPLTIPRLPSL